MIRRYIIIGFVFLLLIGAYFIFFDNEKKDNSYEKYFNKLVDREEYSDDLNGLDLEIEEIEDDGKYSYIVTIDNKGERRNNVKFLVVDENCKESQKGYFPSFGIIDNKGKSLVSIDEEGVKGINLSIGNIDKVENFLIYFSSDGQEQFIRVKVANYLN